MVIQIVNLITAAVVVIGIIMTLLVWKKKMGYRFFFKVGIITIAVSILLMIISFLLQIIFFIGVPILALGIIYLLIGTINKNK